jgi:hypothetical protein
LDQVFKRKNFISTISDLIPTTKHDYDHFKSLKFSIATAHLKPFYQALKSCQGLEELYLELDDVKHSKEIMNVVSYLPNLKKLSLNYSSCIDFGTIEFELNSNTIEELKIFGKRNSTFHNDSISSICKLKSLTNLSFNTIEYTDSNFKILASGNLGKTIFRR